MFHVKHRNLYSRWNLDILSIYGGTMIYFDHAATSYPKPPEVLKEASKVLQYFAGNPRPWRLFFGKKQWSLFVSGAQN